MRKKLIISVGIGALVVSILVLYFLFVSKNHEIVTLVPDETPTKTKPRDPGGIVIPHSDSLVYEKLNPNYVKHNKVYILPDPEEPIEIIRNVETQEKLLDSIDTILSNIEYYEKELLQEESVDNDNTEYIVPNTLLAQEDNFFDKQNSQRVVIPGTSLRVEKATEDRYKEMRVNVVSDKEEGYKIQLSLAYSLADANKQWKKIQQKHYKILQDANLIVKKVEGKNERIFYLIMAGSYPSLNHAKLVCTKLSYKKQNCIVVK